MRKEKKTKDKRQKVTDLWVLFMCVIISNASVFSYVTDDMSVEEKEKLSQAIYLSRKKISGEDS